MVLEYMEVVKKSIYKYIVFLSVAIVSFVVLWIVTLYFFLVLTNIHESNKPIKFYEHTRLSERTPIVGDIEEITESAYLLKINELSSNLKWNLIVFPESVSNSYNEFFSYFQDCGKKDAGRIHRAEIYLKRKFTNDIDFQLEIRRIANIEQNNHYLFYIEDLFDFPSYMAYYNFDPVYEYVLVDYDELTLHYIFMSEIGKDNFVFDEKYAPVKRLKDSSFPTAKNEFSYMVYR